MIVENETIVINRGNYARRYQVGQGNWQHNPEHRKGVSYRDPRTAQSHNRASGNGATCQVSSRGSREGRR